MINMIKVQVLIRDNPLGQFSVRDFFLIFKAFAQKEILWVISCVDCITIRNPAHTPTVIQSCVVRS